MASKDILKYNNIFKILSLECNKNTPLQPIPSHTQPRTKFCIKAQITIHHIILTIKAWTSKSQRTFIIKILWLDSFQKQYNHFSSGLKRKKKYVFKKQNPDSHAKTQQSGQPTGQHYYSPEAQDLAGATCQGRTWGDPCRSTRQEAATMCQQLKQKDKLPTKKFRGWKSNQNRRDDDLCSYSRSWGHSVLLHGSYGARVPSVHRH